MPESKIFISYRRVDSAYAARLLYDRLSARFGEDNIFMDVEGVDPGEDFVESLEQAVSSCDVLLALIGQQWITATDEQGEPRLDNPEDFVRLEIAAALKRNVLVIPVLVEQARMPHSFELPVELGHLARLNALEVRHERFNVDADYLVHAIEKYIGQSKNSAHEEQVHPIPPGDTTANISEKRPVKPPGTVSRRVWYLGGGIGLIIILVLILWGGNTVLTVLRGTETPDPESSTSLPENVTNTAAPNTTEAPVGSPEAFATQSIDIDEVSMILIPAGPFKMGSQDSQNEDRPDHTIRLDDFYIDQYEVTNASYAKCVAAGSCQPPSITKSDTVDDYYRNIAFAEYPMINVNWYDSLAYCNWRGGRLPTEAEWEKAGRGDLEGKLFPWGNESPDCTRANFYYGSYCVGDTNRVGSYDPNGYGLYDMAGNVSEWTADWYDAEYYADSPTNNPQGPESGETRVIRGGSWHLVGRDVQVSYRDSFYPNLGRIDIGFRCVRDLVP